MKLPIRRGSCRCAVPLICLFVAMAAAAGTFAASWMFGRSSFGSSLAELFAAAPADAGASTECAVEPPIPGLVAEKPESGRFVETERGFMVPYTMRVPGTELSFEMVPIPGGTFRMGSPEGEANRDEGEGPQFTVRVEPFWMGKHEVTWGEYKEYMALLDLFKHLEQQEKRPVPHISEADAVTIPSTLWEPATTFQFGEDARQPAVSMSQFAARQYTKWLSGLTGLFHRLPSEAEWEYACRAGTTTAFSFGDDPEKFGEYGWYYDNAEDKTHLVGQKKPNPWGLHDMHGNIAEWVLDQYDPNAYARFEGKTVAARETVRRIENGELHVYRGGSFFADPPECRSAARAGSEGEDWQIRDPNLPKSPWWYSDDPALEVGFRVVRPLDAPVKEERGVYWDVDNEQTRHALVSRLGDKAAEKGGDDVKRVGEGRGTVGIIDRKLGKELPELRRMKAEYEAEQRKKAATNGP